MISLSLKGAHTTWWFVGGTNSTGKFAFSTYLIQLNLELSVQQNSHDSNSKIFTHLAETSECVTRAPETRLEKAAALVYLDPG